MQSSQQLTLGMSGSAASSVLCGASRLWAVQALGTGFTAEGQIHPVPECLSVPDMGSLMAATAPEASPWERHGTWCPPWPNGLYDPKAETRAKNRWGSWALKRHAHTKLLVPH